MNHSLDTMGIDSLRDLTRKIVRELGFMQEGLANTDLSPSAVHSLVEIGNGTVDTASELAELLRLEKSSISRLLKKLEIDGLLHTDVAPEDKRARIIALTPKGKTLLRQIEDYAREQLFTALRAVPAEGLRSIEIGLSTFANALSSRKANLLAADTKLDIREGYQPRLISDVTYLHASFYAKNYGFGAVFERKVATEMSEFIGRIDRPNNKTISAYIGDQLLGSVSLDGEDLEDSSAHLRWFIVSPSAQGLGVGKRLLNRATAFVDERGFQKTRLWTFQGLDAARHLYEMAGFELAKEQQGAQWGAKVIEQEFMRLKPK